MIFVRLIGRDGRINDAWINPTYIASIIRTSVKDENIQNTSDDTEVWGVIMSNGESYNMMTSPDALTGNATKA